MGCSANKDGGFDFERWNEKAVMLQRRRQQDQAKPFKCVHSTAAFRQNWVADVTQLALFDEIIDLCDTVKV